MLTAFEPLRWPPRSETDRSFVQVVYDEIYIDALAWLLSYGVIVQCYVIIAIITIELAHLAII